jgi:MFS family permease
MFAFVTNNYALLVIGPLVGFFGTGYFSGFSVISSELFPTQLRASAMGFVYNIGRIASAAGPYLIGRFSESMGISAALSMTSGAFLVAAVIAMALRVPALGVKEN